MTTILQISDLHIYDPVNPDEYLRLGFYKEYLSGLFTIIKTSGIDIAILAITGDLVHRGKVEHFSHAETIINYIAKELNIATDNVIISLGNHDIPRNIKDYNESRSAFTSLVSKYGNRHIISDHNSKIGSHCKVNGLDILLLDSNLSPPAEGCPGEMTDADVDTLMEWIQSTDITQPLIILSHFPADVHFLQYASKDLEDPDWLKKHLWSDASTLFNRLGKWRTKAKTIWLCGDIHRSDQSRQGKIYSISCGRLGTGANNTKTTQVHRQVKLVHFSDENIFTEVIDYQPPQHSDKPILVGEWNRCKCKEFSQDNEIIENDKLSSVTYKKLTIINDDTENDIISFIRDKKLYYFGRYNTTLNQVALSWVNIGPLLNDRLMYVKVINHFKKWIESEVMTKLTLNASDVVLIGVDCWGAIIASQLSIVTNIPNICIATRARGNFSIPTEKISHGVIDKVGSVKAVILISDVVRTGESYKYIYSKIKSHSTNKDHDILWYGLSVIWDKMQINTENMSFITSSATLVGQLRMPVVGSDILPDSSILPCSISFNPSQN